MTGTARKVGFSVLTSLSQARSGQVTQNPVLQALPQALIPQGDVRGASNDETQVLKRGTLWPKQDFVVLPLEVEMVRPIMAAVGGTLPRGLFHVQVQKEGRLQLGLYDNFDPNCMFLGPGLTPSFIATLQEAGVLTHWIER